MLTNKEDDTRGCKSANSSSSDRSKPLCPTINSSAMRLYVLLVLLCVQFAGSVELSEEHMEKLNSPYCDIDFLNGRVLVGIFRDVFYQFQFDLEDEFIPLQLIQTKSRMPSVHTMDESPTEHDYLPILAINDTWLGIFRINPDGLLCYAFTSIDDRGIEMIVAAIGDLPCLSNQLYKANLLVLFANENNEVKVAYNAGQVDYVGNALYSALGQFAYDQGNETWFFEEIDDFEETYTLSDMYAYPMVKKYLAVYGSEYFPFVDEKSFMVVYNHSISITTKFGVESDEGKWQMARERRCIYAKNLDPTIGLFQNVMLLPEYCVTRNGTLGIRAHLDESNVE